MTTEPEHAPYGKREDSEQENVLHCAICEGKTVRADTPICDTHYQQFLANWNKNTELTFLVRGFNMQAPKGKP